MDDVGLFTMQDSLSSLQEISTSSEDGSRDEVGAEPPNRPGSSSVATPDNGHPRVRSQIAALTSHGPAELRSSPVNDKSPDEVTHGSIHSEIHPPTRSEENDNNMGGCSMGSYPGSARQHSSDVHSLVGLVDSECRLSTPLGQERLMTVNGERSAQTDDMDEAENDANDEDAPWWVHVVKKECLGRGDESTRILNHTDVDVDKDIVELGEPESPYRVLDDDRSLRESEADWQERLWTAARNHYLKDDATSETKLDDVDTATLVASFDRFHGDRTRISEFQEKLIVCLDAYVEVFHDSPLELFPSIEDETPPIRLIDTVSSDVQISPYVPLDVARMLFGCVLAAISNPQRQRVSSQYLGSNKTSSCPETFDTSTIGLSADEAAGLGDVSESVSPTATMSQACAMPKHPEKTCPTTAESSGTETQFDSTLEAIMMAVLSPELGAFDRFSVDGSVGTDNDHHSQDVTNPSGYRVKKAAELTKLEKQELHVLLYGKMAEEEEPGPGGRLTTTGPREEEVRVLTAALTHIRKRRIRGRNSLDGDSRRTSSSIVFAERILSECLSNHLHDVRLNQDQEMSLRMIYIARYLPHFVLRAAWRQTADNIDSIVDTEMFKQLLRLFEDVDFIRMRMAALGIYNGVLVHVEELESLLKAMQIDMKATWSSYYQRALLSLLEYLENILERQMRGAGFVKSETAGSPFDWEADFETQSILEKDFVRLASAALEIGRSMHFLGTSLGRHEQQKVGQWTMDTSMHTPQSFNENATTIEVRSYKDGKGAYEIALKLLRWAEKQVQRDYQRETSSRIDGRTYVEQISVARSTVELHLADTMTTLAYCLEEKLTDKAQALGAYKESLFLFAKHAGKKHLSVIHSLQRVGILYIEQSQWHDACKVLGEAIALMKSIYENNLDLENTTTDSRIPTDATSTRLPSPAHEDLVMCQRLIGICLVEVCDYEAAVNAFEMAIHFMKMKFSSEDFVHDFDCCESGADVLCLGSIGVKHPLICDLLSRIADAYTLWGADIGRQLVLFQYRKVFSETTTPDARVDSSLCRLCLNVQQKSMAFTDQAIKMRQRLSEIDSPVLCFSLDLPSIDYTSKPCVLGDKATNRLQMLRDLMRRGMLQFHFQLYSDAFCSWEEVDRLLENRSDWFVGGLNKVEDDCELSRYRVQFLLGIVSIRMSKMDQALNFFNSTLNILNEMKIKSYDEDHGIDLDIARCEQAIGTVLLLDKKGAMAATHLWSALNTFEAVSTRRGGDVPTSFAIAAVMTSLGKIYYNDNKFERSRRLLEGATQIHTSMGKKLSRTGVPAPKSHFRLLGFSPGQPVLAAGDALLYLASAQLEISPCKARTAFETAACMLESFNSISELSIQLDDETDFEFLGKSFHSKASMACYTQLLESIDEAPDGRLGLKEAMKSQLTREDILFRMGNVHARCGEFNSALTCLAEAKYLTVARLGTKDHMIIVNILFNIGCVRQSMYESSVTKGPVNSRARDLAVEAFSDSLHISRLIQGTVDAAQNETRTRLASLLMMDEQFDMLPRRDHGDDDSATRLLRASLEWQKRQAREGGLEAAESLYRLGVILLRSRADFKFAVEARQELRKCLAIRRPILGDHIDVAKVHYALAFSIRVCKSGAEAKLSNEEVMHHLTETLRITESLPVEDPNERSSSHRPELSLLRSKALLATGCLVETRGDSSKALVMLENALRALGYSDDRNGSNCHVGSGIPCLEQYWAARVHQQLGICRAKGGFFGEAIGGLAFCLEGRDSNFRSNLQPGKVLRSFIRGDIHRKYDRIALPVEKEATVSMSNLLGVCFFKVGKVDEALRELSWCLHACSSHSPQDFQSVEVLVTIGLVYFQVHDYDQCIRALRHAFKLSKEVDCYLPTKADALLHMNLARSLMSRNTSSGEARLHLNLAVDILENASVANLQSMQSFNLLSVTTTFRTWELIDSETSATEMLLECYYSILLLIRRHGGGSSAPEEEVDVLHKIGSTEATLGYLEKAENTFNEVLRTLDRCRILDNLRVADVLFNLGSAYSQTGQIERAVDCHLESHRLSAKVLGEDNVEHAENIMCLGNLEFCRENFDKSMDWYDTALVLLMRRPADNVLMIGEVLHRKGNVHDILEQYDEAVDALGRVLQLGRSIQEMDQFDLSNVLTALGGVHTKREELPEALKCHQESLRIRLRRKDELGAANSKNNVAACLSAMGRVKDAKALYAEALLTKTGLLGESHVETARTLYNLGQLYISDNQLDLAGQFFREAIRIFQGQPNADKDEVASCLFSLAIVLEGTGETAEATAFLVQARDVIGIPTDGVKSPLLSSILVSLGEMASESGETTEATEHFENALNFLPAEDVVSFSIKYQLACTAKSDGAIDRSIAIHREVLGSRLEYFGRNHPDVAMSMFALAELYFNRDEFNDALALFCESLRIQELNGTIDGPFFVETEVFLGATLRELGSLRDSLRHLRRALAATENIEGMQRATVARIEFKIGIVHCELRRFEDAMISFQRSLDLRIEMHGRIHPDVACTIENIAIVEQKRGDHASSLRHFAESLEIKREFVGEYEEEVARIVEAMAVSHVELKHFEEAFSMFHECVVRLKAIHGLKHQTVARTLLGEGRSLEKLGKLDEASLCYEEALACYSLNDASIERGRLLLRLGGVSFKIGEYGKSCNLYQETLRILEGDVQARVQRSREERSQNDRDLIVCYESLIRLAQDFLSTFSIDMVDVLSKLAAALLRLGNYSSASKILRDVLVRQRRGGDAEEFEIASALHNLGGCHLKMHNYEDAFRCLDEALSKMRGNPDLSPLVLADTVYCIGLVHHARSDLMLALACFDEASKLAKHGTKSFRINTERSMATLLQTMGMYDASMKRCDEILRLTHNSQSDYPLVLADVLECIASCQKGRGDYRKSVQFYRDSLEIRQKELGLKSPAVGKTYSLLGDAVKLQGDPIGAHTCFVNASQIMYSYVGCHYDNSQLDQDGRLSIPEIIAYTNDLQTFVGCTKSGSHLGRADTVAILGVIEVQSGRFDEAVIACEVALSMYRKVLNSGHLKIADLSFTMGVARYERGDFTGSILHLDEAFHLRSKKLSERHPDVLEVQLYRGLAFAASGDSRSALISQKEIMKARTEGYCIRDVSDEAGMLLQMGMVYLDEEQISEAESCFRDCVNNLQKRGSGPTEQQRLSEALHYLGFAQFAMRRFDEAEQHLQSSLRLSEKNNEGHGFVKTLFLLGRVAVERRQYNKAMSLFEKCDGIVAEDGSDEERLILPRVRSQMGAVLLIGQANYDRALTCLVSARDMLTSELGSDHCEVIGSVVALGQVHIAKHDFSSARTCFESALQSFERRMIPRSPLRGDALHLLGACDIHIHNFNAAHVHLAEALHLRLSNAGPDDKKVGESQRRLAFVKSRLKQDEASLQHYLEGIRIGMIEIKQADHQFQDKEVEELHACFDEAIALATPCGDTETAGNLYLEKGMLQSLVGSYSAALESYGHAIARYTECFGELHLSIGNALLNCGVCWNELGDPDRAVTCLSQSLSIVKTSLGDDHEQAADVMFQLAKSYRQKSDVKEAQIWCERALQIRQKSESSSLAVLFRYSGELHILRGQMNEAENSMRECIRLLRALEGEDSFEVATALYRLGELYELHLRDPVQALRCQEESLRIHLLLKEDRSSASFAQSYLCLGRIHATLRGERKAHYCLDRAIEICMDVGEPQNEVIAEARIAKGQLFVVQGKNEDALIQFIMAHGLRQIINGVSGDEQNEKIGDVLCLRSGVYDKVGRMQDALFDMVSAMEMYEASLGSDHWKVAAVNQLMAEMHIRTSDNEKALACARRAFTIRKALFGDIDERTGASSFIVGKVYFAWKDFDKATLYLEATLSAIREARGDRNLTVVADSMYFLGCIHESRKELDESLSCFQGALSGRQHHLGRDHASVSDVLFKLGKLHCSRVEFDLAVDCFRECRRIRLAIHGPDHTDVADTLYHLANALPFSGQASRKAKPMQYYIDAIRIYKLTLGENHVVVAKCLDNLGGIFEDKGSLEKAGKCYERATHIFEVNLPRDVTQDELKNLQQEEDYEAFAATLLDLATYYDRSGKDSSALKSYHRALKLFKILHGDGHDVIATILCNIANLLARLHRYDEAMVLLGEALRRRTKSFGKQDPSVGHVHFLMAIIYDTLKKYDDALKYYEKALRTQQDLDAAQTLSHMGMLHGNRGDFVASFHVFEDALAIYKHAGYADEDPVVVTAMKHQATAKQMLEHVTDEN